MCSLQLLLAQSLCLLVLLASAKKTPQHLSETSVSGDSADVPGADLPFELPEEPDVASELAKEREEAKEKRQKKLKEKKKQKQKKKSAKDWSKLDINEMTDEWEDGDDEAELEHEYERIQRIAAKKAERAAKVMKSGNSKKIKEVMKSGAMDTKGGMVFITLTDMQLDGTPWTPEVQDLMCGRWSALLRTASLQANIYNMEPGQILLQVDKGWMFNDVLRFIMQQPEVVKGYKDGKDYLPSMFDDEDD